jgi:Peptidase S7, Flavivirus NS3 serine protease
VVKHGRGRRSGRIVVTAAHCLPTMPPVRSGKLIEDVSYAKILGPLGEEPTVSATCLFADPVSDVALLGPPDKEALPDENDAFEALIDAAIRLPIGDIPEATKIRAWLLSVEEDWLPCSVIHHGGNLLIENASFTEGMSGSPILNDQEMAIGLVTVGSQKPGTSLAGRGFNPRLVNSLPVWAVVDALKLLSRFRHNWR